MAKRKKASGGDIPEWVVTYGDLMSLLLCFFILIAAFSEIKKEREYQEVVRSIQEAFGFQGGVGQIETDTPPTNSNISRMEQIIQSTGQESRQSEERTPSINGPDPTTAYLAEGVKTVVGTTIPFEGGSSDISPTTEAYLVEHVVPKLIGRFNVEIRGHAFGRDDRAAGGSVDDMSFQRAKAVKDFLVSQGIESSRLVIIAAGSTQPISTDVSDRNAMGQNRRVQIILTEELPSDTHPDPNGTSPNAQ